MKRVLIVDDKPDNLYLLNAMLESEGYEILAAKNGAEALGLMRNIIPDIIISDILMPIMDGFTLCRECKKDDKLSTIPFFFYTATYTDSKDEEYALGLGADKFLLKPQEPDVFVALINEFLSDVTKNKVKPAKIASQPEAVVLKEYNEVLVRKVEDKMLQMEKAEKELRQYAEKLEKEIIERKQAEEELKKYRASLEELVKKRTEELELKNKELEEYIRLFEGREFRIKELRDRVKELEDNLDNS